jgi:hypothetical protein
MSTITIPQPELTTEEVSAALRKGLGPRYQVLPGGLSALRLVNTIVIAPRVRRTLRTAFGV